MSNKIFYDKINLNSDKINKKGMYSIEKKEEIDLDLKKKFICNSYAIENNDLSYEDLLKIFSLENSDFALTPDVVSFSKAYDFVMHEANNNSDLIISEELIEKLHYLLFSKIYNKNSGVYRTNNSISGIVKFKIPDYNDVSQLMKHFSSQMEYSKKMMNSFEFAVMCHKRIIDIYPFNYGNFYVAGLILNGILVNNGYVVTSIISEHFNEYLNAIVKSQIQGFPDIDSLMQCILKCNINAQEDCIKILYEL